MSASDWISTKDAEYPESSLSRPMRTSEERDIDDMKPAREFDTCSLRHRGLSGLQICSECGRTRNQIELDR